MEIQKRLLKDGTVRWRQAGRGSSYRARTFERKSDALNFAADLRRRRQLGSARPLDSGRMTLAEYVAET
jgi:hypothetical protein